MDFDESFLASQDFEETVSGTFFQWILFSISPTCVLGYVLIYAVKQ